MNFKALAATAAVAATSIFTNIGSATLLQVTVIPLRPMAMFALLVWSRPEHTPSVYGLSSTVPVDDVVRQSCSSLQLQEEYVRYRLFLN